MPQQKDWQEEAAAMLAYRCPRYGRLPDLDLYMDQVLYLIERILGPFAEPGEKTLTASMVNNYVKQKVLPPPVNKKYNKDHMAYLIVLCLLKKAFTLGEIQQLLAVQRAAYPLDRAYDVFCDRWEYALGRVFAPQQTREGQAGPDAAQRDLLDAAVFAVANRVYVQKRLLWQGRAEPGQA